MSGKGTRIIVIGPNLRVGTLPLGKEEGEVGEGRHCLHCGEEGEVNTHLKKDSSKCWGQGLGRHSSPTHHTPLSITHLFCVCLFTHLSPPGL